MVLLTFTVVEALSSYGRAGEHVVLRVHPRVEERRDERLRQAANPLTLGRRGLDQRGELMGTGQGAGGLGAVVLGVGHGRMVPQAGGRASGGPRCPAFARRAPGLGRSLP